MVAERGKPSRGRKPKTRRTSGEQERFLETPEAIKILGAERRRQEQKRLGRQKKTLRGLTPSSPWLDAKWHDGETFPPPWDHPRTDPLKEPPATAMKACNCCRRWTPPNCIGSSGGCDDCRLAEMTPFELAHLPPSVSAINLRRWKSRARAGKDYHEVG